MIAYRNVLLVAVSGIVLGASSCSGAKKLNKEIAAQKMIEQRLLARLDSATQKMRNKEAEGSLDSYTENYVNKKVAAILKDINTNDSLVKNASNKKERKKASELIILFSKVTQKNLEDVAIISQLFDLNTLKRFNTGAFFGSGQYTLGEAYANDAHSAFAELIGDAYRFAGQFPNQKLNAIIVVTGYADAQGFEKSSALYNELKKIINKDDPANSELNRELSRLRALTIVSTIKETEEKLSNPKKQDISFSYFAEGKGEELPVGKINDYKDNDERRRIVLVYWNVLPL